MYRRTRSSAFKRNERQLAPCLRQPSNQSNTTSSEAFLLRILIRRRLSLPGSVAFKDYSLRRDVLHQTSVSNCLCNRVGVRNTSNLDVGTDVYAGGQNVFLDMLLRKQYTTTWGKICIENRDCSNKTEFFLNSFGPSVRHFQHRDSNLCWRMSQWLDQANIFAM